MVPLSVLSSYCVYGCLFPFFLHVFPPAVVLAVPSCFSPLFGLLCLLSVLWWSSRFFRILRLRLLFPFAMPPVFFHAAGSSLAVPGCPEAAFHAFLLAMFSLFLCFPRSNFSRRSASFFFLIPRAVLPWCLFLLVLVVVLCAAALVLSPPFLPCYVAVASVSLFSDSFESPVPVATWSPFWAEPDWLRPLFFSVWCSLPQLVSFRFVSAPFLCLVRFWGALCVFFSRWVLFPWFSVSFGVASFQAFSWSSWFVWLSPFLALPCSSSAVPVFGLSVLSVLGSFVAHFVSSLPLVVLSLLSLAVPPLSRPVSGSVSFDRWLVLFWALFPWLGRVLSLSRCAFLPP